MCVTLTDVMAGLDREVTVSFTVMDGTATEGNNIIIIHGTKGSVESIVALLSPLTIKVQTCKLAGMLLHFSRIL